MNKALNETFGYGESVTLIAFQGRGGSWQPRVSVKEFKITRPLSVYDCRKLAELFSAAADLAEGPKVGEPQS